MYKIEIFLMLDRIPRVPDTEVLHTFLANRDVNIQPRIRSRAFNVYAKLGKCIFIILFFFDTCAGNSILGPWTYSNSNLNC